MTIQCASNQVIPVQPAGGQPSDELPESWNNSPEFSIEGIKFTVEVCQVGSGMYDALTQRLLAERGSIDVPYPQYQVFSATSNNGASEIRGSVSCMSLDRVYAVSRNNDATYGWTKHSNPVSIQDGIGNAYQQRAINFTAANTKSWQFTLNNAPMPMYRASPVEAYNFAVCAEDRTYSNDRGSQVHSQSTWLQNKWCATLRFNLDNDPRRLSGVNLSSINAQIVYSPTTGSDAKNGDPDRMNDPHQMMLITKQTSVLRIGQSRACAVVA